MIGLLGRWQVGETIIIDDLSRAVDGGALDISAVNGLPTMIALRADAQRRGPLLPNSGSPITFTASFVAANGNAPPMWRFVLLGGIATAGGYLVNSSYPLIGGGTMKTDLSVIEIEWSAA